jgi:hypothetical protein
MPRKTKRRNNKGKGKEKEKRSSSSSTSSSINSASLINGTRSLIQSGKIKISSASDNSSKSDTLGDTIAVGGISIIIITALLLSLRKQEFLRHI